MMGLKGVTWDIDLFVPLQGNLSCAGHHEDGHCQLQHQWPEGGAAATVGGIRERQVPEHSGKNAQ